MDVLTQIVAWLNAGANAVGSLVLAPIGYLPGWLSATLVAALSGLMMLFAFKYTSNQRAIKAARDSIKANLLALKLFKDNVKVTFGAQGAILLGAGRLLLHAVLPMLVMALPATLILAQLSLWYQARPLHVGEEAVVTVKLNGPAGSSWPDLSLQPTDALEVSAGPVRIQSQREVCWNIKARASGFHQLVFQINGQAIEKDLAIGDGFMRVSLERPGWSWSDMLLHPAEPPFALDSPLHAIVITYPTRSSWTSGTDWWMAFWFIASFVAALCFRRLVRVNL